MVGMMPFDLENVDALVGSFLGCEPSDVVIRDLAVHPLSHNVSPSGRANSPPRCLRIWLDGPPPDLLPREGPAERGYSSPMSARLWRSSVISGSPSGKMRSRRTTVSRSSTRASP